MKLYDSYTDDFVTLKADAEPIRIYCCGITPYDTTHLGHAFTYCTVDVLVRYLHYRGTETRYIQNVTDIDDDILREASKRGEDWKRMGDRWTAHFIEDMTALNVLPPTELPRATEAIPEIIEAVKKLVDSGHAYISEGSVYFDLEASPEYGSLSKLSRDEMLPIANERGNHPEDPAKKQPLDFVLWQAQAPGEPAWDSPWGSGRPGWHIECSTLASRTGPTLDIHAGGADLIFPHHESEIVQSAALHGAPLSRSWMHVAMVEHQGEKMSKSLGNLVLVREMLDSWSPNAIRLYLASRHYRQPWEYSRTDLELAADWADTLRRAVQRDDGSGIELVTSESEADFEKSMDDDLDTPSAVRTVIQLGREILEWDGSVEVAKATLELLAGVLGLRLVPGPPQPALVDGWRRHLSENLTTGKYDW